jgi:SlyX protein
LVQRGYALPKSPILSNTAMTSTSPTPVTADDTAAVCSRIDALEIKASDADDSIEQLNLAVYRQQQQIDRLMAQVAQLRMQIPEGGPGMGGSARDELPPHY